MVGKVNGGRVELTGKPYDTKDKVESALEVADIVTLKGFSSSAANNLKTVLTEVLSTWKVYAGSGADPKIVAKVAGKGRRYILATLEAF